METYELVKNFHKKYPGGFYWRLKSHSKIIDNYIDNDENIILAFGAQKNEKFSEVFNTFIFALTNKRIILGHKRLIWGSFMYSITPDLYNDMEIYRGLIWGKVIIDTVKEKIILSNLPKSCLDDIETTISNYMMKEKKKYKEFEKDIKE